MAKATRNETIDFHGVRYTLGIHVAEEGGFWGEIVEIPGCGSQGDTKAQLRTNITDALQALADVGELPASS